MVTAFRRIVVEPTSAAVNRRGFTLIEMVIALAIIAILMVVSMPDYEEQLVQGRRSDGSTALTIFSQRVERYFLENGSYSGATTSIYKETSDEGYYTLSITTTDDSYQLQATATGVQTGDSTCGNLTLNNQGERGITGSGIAIDCWH